MEHEEYMRQALELARLAMAEGEVPVGCVIVRDGAVVGRGRNRRETAQTALGHAELEAIAQACRTLGGWRLAGCALYVTLEPCPMCAGAIQQARLSRVIFGARDERAGCCGSIYRIPEDPALPGFCPCDGGLLEAECAQIMSEFFRGRLGGAPKTVGSGDEKDFERTGGRLK